MRIRADPIPIHWFALIPCCGAEQHGAELFWLEPEANFSNLDFHKVQHLIKLSILMTKKY